MERIIDENQPSTFSFSCPPTRLEEAENLLLSEAEEVVFVGTSYNKIIVALDVEINVDDIVVHGVCTGGEKEKRNLTELLATRGIAGYSRNSQIYFTPVERRWWEN